MNRLLVIAVGVDRPGRPRRIDPRPVLGRGAALAAAGALLAASGCAASPPSAAPASGTRASGAPTTGAPTSGAASARTPSARGTGVARAASAPGAAYLALAAPANRRLDHDFDAFDGPDRAALVAARADLRDIAATEREFDDHLVTLALPPDAQAWARDLITANEARADLTSRAAEATSLAGLDALRPSLKAANAPVERAVAAVRHDLGLPPPDTH